MKREQKHVRLSKNAGGPRSIARKADASRTGTTPRYRTNEERWTALTQRDPAAVEAFVYGVRTTGIFCRPTCRSRVPDPRNVEFFDCAQSALKAGFRPCKRCEPLDQDGAGRVEPILRACGLMEAAETAPDMVAIARAVGMSRYHFQRQFKRVVGITPKQYADAARLKRFKGNLHRTGSVSEAIYASGYKSSSRAYEGVSQKLGMTPGDFRARGAGNLIRYATTQCPLGWLLVAATDKGVCAIELGDDSNELRQCLQRQFPRAELRDDPVAIEPFLKTIHAYFRSPASALQLPLDIRGTAFQRRVWQVLQQIPVGRTASYTDVARKMRRPRAVRAVARACATNAIALAIPCHRVVRSDGALSGYRWGPDRKKSLLIAESKAASPGKHAKSFEN